MKVELGLQLVTLFESRARFKTSRKTLLESIARGLQLFARPYLRITATGLQLVARPYMRVAASSFEDLFLCVILQKAMERGEKLESLADETEKMKNSALIFSKNTSALQDKYKKQSKWYHF